MDLLKAVMLGAVLAGCIAIVIGSQGTSAGPLAIQRVPISDYKVFWSWPLFFSGTGLSWALMLLQR